MTLCIFTDPAEKDMSGIYRFIKRQNRDAATRLMERIKQKCLDLANFPNMGRRWDNSIPPLRSFPVESYLIFYRPIEGGIEVVRVVSGYRDIDSLFSRQEEEG